jgi:hypothetical protein
MRDALWIASAGAAATIGLLLVLHWRRSRDRFFALFAAAFVALAANYALLPFLGGRDETKPYVFIVRLAAFLLIIVAIVDKNRPVGRVSLEAVADRDAGHLGGDEYEDARLDPGARLGTR